MLRKQTWILGEKKSPIVDLIQQNLGGITGSFEEKILQLLQEKIELLLTKRIIPIAAKTEELFVKNLRGGVKKRGQYQFQRP